METNLKGYESEADSSTLGTTHPFGTLEDGQISTFVADRELEGHSGAL